jgi:hypothetical protein
MNRAALGEATRVLLAASAFTFLLTYPLAPRLTHVGRINTDDGRFSIWTVAWVAHALTTDPLNVYDANMFYPHRSTLAYSEANLGAGLLGVPFWLATHNPHATHNGAVLLSFIISFAGAYYLARYLTGHAPVAYVAAVLYAFCPFVFARTAHIQLLMVGGLPWTMLAFHRLADRPTVGRATALGLAIWAQALSCSYYGIFAGMMVGLATLVTAAIRPCWRSREDWVGIALAAFVSVGLTLPFFVPYLRIQSTEGFARTLDDARDYSANLEAWGASSAWAHRWWLSAIEGYNEALFPGIFTLIAAAAGIVWLVRRRGDSALPRYGRDIPAIYGAIAIITFWSSFGPDAGLYWVLYETIPIFSFLRAPGRIGIAVVLSLVVLALPLLVHLVARAKRPAFVGGLLALLAAAELNAAPLTQLREVEPIDDVYRVIATLPRGAVAEFPFWYNRMDFPRHAYYLLNSTAHWKPLVNGYGDHIPADFRKIVVPLSSFPSRESFGILAKADARYVVFHLNMYNRRNRERLLYDWERQRPMTWDGCRHDFAGCGCEHPSSLYEDVDLTSPHKCHGRQTRGHTQHEVAPCRVGTGAPAAPAENAGAAEPPTTYPEAA